VQRPISPHLQIYKPQVTSIMSIMHRASGVAIAVGLLWISLLFIAAPYGAETYAGMSAIIFSTLGKIVLLLFSAGLFFHLCNGIRHLVWDTGRGLTIASIKKSATIVLIAALVLLALLIL
jgi:succinate dehydrogenase / fumarate reductase, cytochrome b subunit